MGKAEKHPKSSGSVPEKRWGLYKPHPKLAFLGGSGAFPGEGGKTSKMTVLKGWQVYRNLDMNSQD